jgi:23S rRNA (adenine2030-N6)-methyltransferase
LKYRHSFHAGNFADVHKHVALLELLAALKRKPKGFLYLDTHAGRGSYDTSGGGAEAAAGVGRFLAGEHRAEALRRYADLLARVRAARATSHLYPGSPLIALGELREQDRALLVEWQAAEAQALRSLVESAGTTRARAERGDGLKVLRAALPPPERRALIFIDPPFEEQHTELERLLAAVTDGLRRFATGVFALWYPIKEQRATDAWHAQFARAVAAPTLVSQLWLYPRDSRVALNGSGLLIVNPPWQIEAAMREWLPELATLLGAGAFGGSEVRMLSQSVQ